MQRDEIGAEEPPAKVVSYWRLNYNPFTDEVVRVFTLAMHLPDERAWWVLPMNSSPYRVPQSYFPSEGGAINVADYKVVIPGTPS